MQSTNELHVVECASPTCRAKVVWLRTASGARMPVDADTVLVGETLFDPRKHRSHFATCPDSAHFRRKRHA